MTLTEQIRRLVELRKSSDPQWPRWLDNPFSTNREFYKQAHALDWQALADEREEMRAAIIGLSGAMQNVRHIMSVAGGANYVQSQEYRLLYEAMERHAAAISKAREE